MAKAVATSTCVCDPLQKSAAFTVGNFCVEQLMYCYNFQFPAAELGLTGADVHKPFLSKDWQLRNSFVHGSALAASGDSFQKRGGTAWPSNKLLHRNMPEFESPPAVHAASKEGNGRVCCPLEFCSVRISVSCKHVAITSMYLDL